MAERARGSCGAVQQAQGLTGPRSLQAEEDLVEEPVPGRGLSTPLARAQCKDDREVTKDEVQDLVQGAGEEELHSEVFAFCCLLSLGLILASCLYIWLGYMQLDHFTLHGIMTLSLAIIFVFGGYYVVEDLYMQGIIT